MATCLVLLILIVILNGEQTNTSSPIPNELDCIGSVSVCDGFCGETTEETLFIGIQDAICPNYPDLTHDVDTVDFSTTLNIESTNIDEDEGCIIHSMGCGISWLCQILNDESNPNPTNETDKTISSCSIGDILFNIHQLQCDINDHGVFAATTQYTQFKLKQFCCDSDLCIMQQDPSCSYSDTFTTYNNDLYECIYSENAINNKYGIVKQCNDTYNKNDYDETCDFLISQSYSYYGCQCKSSFLIGHEKHNPFYNDLISLWNTKELESQLIALRDYGCASDIVCIPNDENDDIFVGGLLNIEQILYQVICQVFLPYSLIDGNIIQDIEEHINHNPNQIYVTFSDQDNNHNIHSEGRIVDVLAIYFNKTHRDTLYYEWINNTDLFGPDSIISNVTKIDINQTLQYYGADEYHKRPSRDTQVLLIGIVVFAVLLSVILIIITLICRKDDFKKTN